SGLPRSRTRAWPAAERHAPIGANGCAVAALRSGRSRDWHAFGACGSSRPRRFGPGGVPKWARGRSAKPLFASSNLAAASLAPPFGGLRLVAWSRPRVCFEAPRGRNLDPSMAGTTSEPQWIDDDEAFRALVDRLVDEPLYGFDTEFHR